MGELFREFFRLRTMPAHTAELMPWGGLIAPGVLDCKDGSYLTSYQIRGPDLESATESEVGGVHWQLSNTLKRVLSPSAVWFEMRRRRSQEYPPSVRGPAFALMADAERRHQFQAEGVHFESEFFLTLGYRPPSLTEALWSRFIVTHMPKRMDQHLAASLEAFQALAERFTDLLKGSVPYVTPLDDAALLRYLKYCATLRDQPVHVPDPPDDLDWFLADRDLSAGFTPVLIDREGYEDHMRVCTIRTFPDETIAGMLDPLRNVDFELRFVSRFLPLSQAEAEVQLRKLEKQILTTEVSFGGMLAHVLGGGASRVRSNSGAELFAKDTDAARQENFTDVVRFGRWTACVVVWAHELSELNRRQRAVEQIIHGVGLGCHWETLNAVDAWCGTMPGHWEANVIQPIIHTLNKAQLEPVSAPWAGVTWNDHLDGPPLFYAQTHGNTPFRVSLWVGDVGNTLFVGPIGSGKSTNVLFALSQFVARYARAQGYILEVGASGKALTYAMGGQYFDLGSPDLAFQPLRDIDDEQVRRWAHEWVQDRFKESDVTITPEHRNEVWRALGNLATAPAHQRTLTGLMLTLQSRELREALKYYTIDGPHGLLLDADADSLPRGTFQGFDLKGLLDKPRVVPAVLSYLLHRLEGCLNGSPTVLVCDDFAKYLVVPTFVDLLDGLVRLRRKDNLAIWFSTQTGADILGTSIAQLVLDSCMTRILLPNPAAMDEANDEVYAALRMNRRQRRLIARAQPKCQFYFDSPQGSRLCDLPLDGLTLAVCGANSDEDRKLVDRVYAEAGPEGFLEAFARAKGLEHTFRTLHQEVLHAVEPCLTADDSRRLCQ
jgi:type IV secretion/conjugal transfer VirB4 family ATPase